MGKAGPSHLLNVLQLIHQWRMADGQGVGFVELCWLMFASWPACSGEGEQNTLPPPFHEPCSATFQLSS